MCLCAVNIGINYFFLVHPLPILCWAFETGPQFLLCNAPASAMYRIEAVLSFPKCLNGITPTEYISHFMAGSLAGNGNRRQIPWGFESWWHHTNKNVFVRTRHLDNEWTERSHAFLIFFSAFTDHLVISLWDRPPQFLLCIAWASAMARVRVVLSFP